MINHQLLDDIAARRPDHPHNLLIITDAGVDLDDEFALIIAAALQRLGFVKLWVVVANMRPSILRSRLVRGLLTLLGYGRDLEDISVGMGSGMIEKRNGEPCPTEDVCSYLAPLDELVMGDEALVNALLDAEPQSLTLVLQSGFTDASSLALHHGDLLRAKVREVVIMGGVMTDQPVKSWWRRTWNRLYRREQSRQGIRLVNGLMVPDDANNNTFNYHAAHMFYTWCQQVGMPMVVTMRGAATAAQVPFSLYDDMAAYDLPIGQCMADRQFPSIQLLWQRANAPVGSEVRGPLPPRCDRAWFVKVFCGGQDPRGIGPADDISPYLGRFNLYDPLNLLAAIPELRDWLFRLVEVVVNGTTHGVGGLSPTNHQLTRPALAADVLATLIEYGIAAAADVPFGLSQATV